MENSIQVSGVTDYNLLPNGRSVFQGGVELATSFNADAQRPIELSAGTSVSFLAVAYEGRPTRYEDSNKVYNLVSLSRIGLGTVLWQPIEDRISITSGVEAGYFSDVSSLQFSNTQVAYNRETRESRPGRYDNTNSDDRYVLASAKVGAKLYLNDPEASRVSGFVGAHVRGGVGLDVNGQDHGFAMSTGASLGLVF